MRLSGSFPATGLGIMAVAFGVWGCHQDSPPEQILDLAGQLDLAEIELESNILDLGTDAARKALSGGWSWNESSGRMSYVWAVGSESWLEFFSSRKQTIELGFRCRPFDLADGTDQTLTLSIDDVEFASLTLAPGMREYRVEIPASVISAGLNALRMGYGYSRSPFEITGSGDHRSLAVAWDWIRFNLDPPLQAPTANRRDGVLTLYPGSQLDFYFSSRPDSQLKIDSIDLDPESSDLDWSYYDDHIGREIVLDIDSLRDVKTITLPARQTAPARLRLRASRSDTTSSGGEAITIRRPVVEAPPASQQKIVSPESVEPPAKSEKPVDIVIYLVDTLRSDRLGAYGNQRQLTPALDTLAASSIVFEQAIAQSSWTKPSVASIFTGLLPFEHGVNHRRHRLADSVIPLADRLQAIGYQTGGFATNPYLNEDSGLQRGFQHFDLSDDPTPQVLNRVADWLDTQKTDVPLLLYVHMVEPHDPYTPPAEFRKRFAPDVTDMSIGSSEHIETLGKRKAARTVETIEALARLYDAEVALADHHFASFVADLDRRGLFEETLLIFVSDHGEAFYEHDVMGHGWDLFREVIEVPLIVRPPGGTKPLRIAKPVPLIDIVPTILDQAGARLSDDHQRPSLLSLAGSGSTDHHRQQTPIFSYMDYDNRRGGSVVLGRWKLIEPFSSGFLTHRLLIDRTSDPREVRNLAREYPATAGWLASLLRQQRLDLEARTPAEVVEFDKKTERQLRALGYIE